MSNATRFQMAIRNELSKMSMEEILQLKEKLGSKLYHRTMGMHSPSAEDNNKITKNKNGKLNGKRFKSIVL